MATELLEFERKELNKAHNLGIIGLIGAIIPITGFLLGLISLITASAVKPTHDQTISKKASILWIAIIAMLLSLIAGVFYYNYYRNIQGENTRANQAAEVAAQQAEFEQQQKERRIQTTLDNCLLNADNRYEENWETQSKNLGFANNQLPSENADRLDQYLREWKDDCYRSAELGDDSNPLPASPFD